MLGVPLAGEGEDAFGLEADFDDDVVAVDADDFAFEDGAVGEGLAGGVHEGGELGGIGAGGVIELDLFGGVLVVEAELAEECVVNHSGGTFQWREQACPPGLQHTVAGRRNPGCKHAGARAGANATWLWRPQANQIWYGLGGGEAIGRDDDDDANTKKVGCGESYEKNGRVESRK